MSSGFLPLSQSVDPKGRAAALKACIDALTEVVDGLDTAIVDNFDQYDNAFYDGQYIGKLYTALDLMKECVRG